MALFRIKSQNIETGTITANTLATTLQEKLSSEAVQSTFDAINAAPTINTVLYANSTYHILDDQAANVGGGYIVITGSSFDSGTQVIVGSNNATSVSYVDSSTLNAQIPAAAAGSYNLQIITQSGGMAFKLNGVTHSETPVWGTAGTLDNQLVNSDFSINLSANSDSNITYSNTSALPDGTTLLSNGYFYGNVTGLVSETTYNFTVLAIDEELQDSPREFSVTVVLPSITSISYANSSYTVLDDTAVDTAGGYIIINGVGFSNDASVTIGGTAATSTTFISSSVLRVEVPAKTAGSYDVQVVTGGSTATLSNGITYSPLPSWVTGTTLTSQASDAPFAISLSATSAVSYSATTSLPSGTNLLSNGYFYGTVTGISTDTNYNFTVVATDAENQDASRTFSITITYTPPYDNFYIYSSGYNNYGQLGTNDKLNKNSPVQLGAPSHWSNVAASYSGGPTVFSKQDDTGFVSGYTSALYLETAAFRSSPTQVAGAAGWNRINGGHNGSWFGIKSSDGSLWTWGTNLSGCLGHSSTATQTSPKQLGTTTGWKKIVSAGSDDSINQHTLAIDSSGRLWSWGGNADGQLGTNNSTSRSSPGQVGTNTGWTECVTGSGHSFGIRSGLLFAWGRNGNGQTGRGTQGLTYSPVQIAGTWTSIAAGDNCSLGIKSGGTLWAWGSAYIGILGLSNNTVYKSSPTQVGTLTNWSKIYVFGRSAFAIKTDGTLWSWGNNPYGHLGLGSTAPRSSPVQVGTLNGYVDVFAGGIYQSYFKRTA